MSDALDQLAVTTLRALAMDAVEQAASGHPGAPMALAPLAHVLATRHLRHDPADPSWADRDRLVLSAGHASMLLYGLLHLTGYDLPLDEIRRFRQLGSATPGHPERGDTPGVETTTGPLGQGLANAVGMALAERMLAARWNRGGHEVVDHRTFVIASDGDLMEGVAAEAASLAGHLGLERLVVCYDDNRITIDGSTDLAFTEDVAARFSAYGWRVLDVVDPESLDELDRTLKEATTPDGRPTLVRVPTTIAHGAPTKAGTSAAHGAPLGADEVAAAKRALGWPHDEPFTVPAEVRAHCDQRPRGGRLRGLWHERLDAYRREHPAEAAELERVLAGDLPDGWQEALPDVDDVDAEATRKVSGRVINALAPAVPELVGGSADLAASNNTTIADGGDVTPGAYEGRNLHFGVREHAMTAAMNGMLLHGGLRPFGGTFLVFSDYLRPSLRLAGLMGLPVVLVATHDSIGLGEDGPTHQPVEHLASLRAMPGVHVVRPADARETVGAWRHALQRRDGPTVLALTRQKVATLPGSRVDGVDLGAYAVVEPDGDPQVVLVATGSEVGVACEAATLLADRGVRARVVSMPCWERAERDPERVAALLPDGVPRLSVEAAASFGWSRWADDHVALDRFGASAPGGELMAHFGFTGASVADRAAALLDRRGEAAGG